MICKKCNAENVENAVFCSSCGAKLAEEAPNVAETPKAAPAPAPQPVGLQVENRSKIPEQYKPVSPWGYFGLNILYCIPVVGFIFLLIHTFNGSNLNRRNYARSFWCALLVGVIIAIVWIVIVLLLALIGINLGEMSYY